MITMLSYLTSRSYIFNKRERDRQKGKDEGGGHLLSPTVIQKFITITPTVILLLPKCYCIFNMFAQKYTSTITAMTYNHRTKYLGVVYPFFRIHPLTQGQSCETCLPFRWRFDGSDPEGGRGRGKGRIGGRGGGHLRG